MEEPMVRQPAIVGVLGGMGPLATVDFMRKLVDATGATSDQDHVPVIVSNIPQVPDRTAAFRGEGASPLESMIRSGQRLVAAGADLVVMPCNTAHLWFDAIRDALGLPMIHLVDAAIEEVLVTFADDARIGLLATEATLASGLYVDRRNKRGHHPDWLLPTATEMAELVMPGIAAVKAARMEAGRDHLARAAKALHGRGARALVLACTEIPLVIDAAAAGMPVIDPTAVLAREAVRWSRRGVPRPMPGP